ncbi:M14 family metallopeptidase [Streptomyces sp. SAJ15]|uniref:M14 family metallopeptidase n=1 Tax=Streptomyces sp. SAJ15 TaxID=2011095 RepID=UPI001185BED2|nr:M14 family metallopeptidase [Streptomyces sp. SAJ15]TVL90368.1 peptidase M14 [Streptomyces sp. SAJ15]
MYLNVAEIESAITSLEGAYPGMAEIVVPPYPTHEGRTTSLLRVGAHAAEAVDGVLMLGGVHAREWVPPDALVSLAADLLEARANGTGLSYGGSSFTAGQIEGLLDTLNLFFFPCVNPDGRAHSQTTAGMWRKNRRPAPAGHTAPSCVGVDLNRNFDFLWDHVVKFAADSGVRTSADPCDPQVYRGPSAGSEPETQNVGWALDAFPRVRWLIDVHSAVPVILHIWGDDQNQSTTPGDNFTNPALDGVRGRPNDGIGEYLTTQNLDILGRLGKRINDAVFAVRSVDYGVEQAYGLYPTSGTSDDYAFSRHIANPGATKVFGFTIECGSSFQPPYSEAEHVIREVSAGLVAFGLGAQEITDGHATRAAGLAGSGRSTAE